MIPRVLLATLATWLLLLSTASAQDTISDDSFSYKIPVGWQIISTPAHPLPVAMDKVQDNFKAYIQVGHVQSSQSLADFASTNKELLKSLFPDVQFISEQPFITASGSQGIRIVTKNHLRNIDIQPIYYLFEGSNNAKYSVCAKCLASSFDRYEPIFDAAVKTLVISRKCRQDDLV